MDNTNEQASSQQHLGYPVRVLTTRMRIGSRDAKWWVTKGEAAYSIFSESLGLSLNNDSSEVAHATG